MSTMNTAKRVWVKPELSVTNLRDAKIGNNSQTIDQAYPAANGSQAHFS